MSITVLGVDAIEITPDPVGDNASEIIPRSHVVGCYPVRYQERQVGDTEWDYVYDSITVIVICLVDGRKLPIELQTVSNQPGWNDGSQSALTNAHNDVHAWLGGGSLAPGPNVSISPSTLNFPGTIVNKYSAAQQLTVSGNNLTNDIVITAPAGYIINLDGSDVDAGPITLVHALGVVAPTTVHVKFHPLAVQAYNGTLTATSTGAPNQNVTLNGSATVPDVSVSPASLSFEDIEVDMFSSPQSFVVSGTGMFANLVITAPAGFIINLNGSTTDAGPISLVPSGAGAVAATTIYVLFAPVTEDVNSGDITCATTGGVTENVAVDGVGLFPQNRVYSYYHNI